VTDGPLINVRGRASGPRFPAANWLIFVGCAGLPWAAWGWYRPLAGLGLLGVWMVLVRPTWRGLAPFYLTALLALNLVAQAVVAVFDV